MQLYNGGTEITDAVSTAFTPNDSGTWTIDIPLTAGTHAVTARVFDLAGNQSTGTASAALSVTTDTTAPTNAPGALSLNGQSVSGRIKKGRSGTATGTTDGVAVTSGDYIVIYSNDIEVGRIESASAADQSVRTGFAVDADGAVPWEVTLPGSVFSSRGTVIIAAKYLDRAGKCFRK